MENLLTQTEPLLERLVSFQERGNKVLIIDGHAGSGKSSLAELIANQVFVVTRQLPKLVHMDDLYPGWHGLREGATYLVERILKPLALRKEARWQNYDWNSAERSGFQSYQGENLLIVEGCGALSRQSRELCDFAIWVDSPAETRKKRFQERDAGMFNEFWPIWIDQEAQFYQAERSAELADLTIQN